MDSSVFVIIALTVFATIGVLAVIAFFVGSETGDDGEETFVADAAPEPEPEPPHLRIYEIGNRLGEFFNVVSHPDEFRTDAAFNEGVALLKTPDFTPEMVIRYATGDNLFVSCMAFEALRGRDDCRELWREAAIAVRTLHPYSQYFALGYLADAAGAEERLIGRTLADTIGYLENRVSRSALEEMIRVRRDRGEPMEIAQHDIAALDGDEIAALRRFLASIDGELATPLFGGIEMLRPEAGARGEVAGDPEEELNATGRFWSKTDAAMAKSVVAYPEFKEAVDHVESLLTANPPQSILLKGDIGVGRTSFQHVLAQQLFAKGWSVFIAGHSDLLAGQSYIGQFEQRLKNVVAGLVGRKKVVWLIPDFHQLAFTGQHQYSGFSALDGIKPYILDGTIRVIADILPAELDRLQRVQPQLVTAMGVFEMKPAEKTATLDIARQWLKSNSWTVEDDFLPSVWDLAQQYLDARAAPGHLMELLKSTTRQMRAAGDDRPSVIETDDVLETLAQQTGLPLALIDPDRDLDLDGLKTDLESQVIGQDDAVQCLVDRVAMLKAGLTDPSRPYGVFLFAGPTGTGKTELAKSLTKWLFGSDKRLVRVDMSELQTPESLDRLVGGFDGEASGSVLDKVREQPFSVVLFDEFEKAHPKAWDLLLQVFDDARLTDRRGRTTSFRHTIIILTSNLGASVPTGQSIGFSSPKRAFDEDEVLKAVEAAFRREFINRIDRIVVFAPLDRNRMRAILQRELTLVLERRGLKGRPWAVEWDESAIDFLLEKGFTPDLGARPLKRAVETHLLTPLATTIVNHQFPDGDQFLFIKRSGDRLDVEFVDPWIDNTVEAASDASGVERVSAAAILLRSDGSPGELVTLRALLDDLADKTATADWSRRKQELLDRMQDPDFWSAPERFETLGLIEAIDRVEGGVERARHQAGRLDAHKGLNKLPPRLISMLAQNVHLLSAAVTDIAENRPRDAFLAVESRAAGKSESAAAAAFAHRIADMYEGWAKKRNMRLRRLHRSAGHQVPMQATYAVNGFGAYFLLRDEAGRHVLETPKENKRSFQRDVVHVRVVAQPDAPLPDDASAALDMVGRCFSEAPEVGTDIVRTYREKPSPIVKDSVKKWRTGRPDLVFGGDFDLFADVE